MQPLLVPGISRRQAAAVSQSRGAHDDGAFVCLWFAASSRCKASRRLPGTAEEMQYCYQTKAHPTPVQETGANMECSEKEIFHNKVERQVRAPLLIVMRCWVQYWIKPDPDPDPGLHDSSSGAARMLAMPPSPPAAGWLSPTTVQPAHGPGGVHYDPQVDLAVSCLESVSPGLRAELDTDAVPAAFPKCPEPPNRLNCGAASTTALVRMTQAVCSSAAAASGTKKGHDVKLNRRQRHALVPGWTTPAAATDGRCSTEPWSVSEAVCFASSDFRYRLRLASRREQHAWDQGLKGTLAKLQPRASWHGATCVPGRLAIGRCSDVSQPGRTDDLEASRLAESQWRRRDVRATETVANCPSHLARMPRPASVVAGVAAD
ncbi:hypothetical protein ACCO45_002949 [Purpureocillium lilacinum]|uniref:Uncharacterized protein n=1 Tax=Purpureocillium lilacinum TaxID=33203 RepID=A0ACC4DYF6_PURLI